MEFYKKHSKENLTYFGKIEKVYDEYFVNNILVENNRAIHNDIVYYDANNKVINIKKRNLCLITGILQLNNNTKYGFTNKNIPYFKFIPTSNKYPTFIIPVKKKLLKQPYYLVIKFNKWDTNNKHPIGQIEHYIGYVGTKDIETNMLLYKHNLYPIKNKITYLDYNASNNIDYYTYSIDPKGCKDIDDAIHIKRLENNSYEVGIHIANVGEHIEINNINSFSSIYLQDNQINMLNDNQTYNTFSLSNNIPKHAISLIIIYQNNKIKSSKFRKSIVFNTTLSYEEAEILKENHTHDLNILHNFICKLQNKKKIHMTKVVEYFMILYNNVGAKILYQYNNNTILRTHSCNNNINDENELSKYLSISNKNSAVYESNPKNTHHSDLDLNYYTHLTSPIRRYVDIINQKNILKFLNNEEIITTNNLEPNNIYNKHLRKFYNNYKKLNIIFNKGNINTYGYIININDIKLNIYIPSLDISHSFCAINYKLKQSNKIDSNENRLIINDVVLKLYDKINIKLTPLVFEEKFNKKLNITITSPKIIIY